MKARGGGLKFNTSREVLCILMAALTFLRYATFSYILQVMLHLDH